MHQWTTAQLVTWRDWLVENIPEDVWKPPITRTKHACRQVAELGYAGRPAGRPAEFELGPLDFYRWHNGSFTFSNMEIRDYLNNWYGDWREVLHTVCDQCHKGSEE